MELDRNSGYFFDGEPDSLHSPTETLPSVEWALKTSQRVRSTLKKIEGLVANQKDHTDTYEMKDGYYSFTFQRHKRWQVASIDYSQPDHAEIDLIANELTITQGDRVQVHLLQANNGQTRIAIQQAMFDSSGKQQGSEDWFDLHPHRPLIQHYSDGEPHNLSQDRLHQIRTYYDQDSMQRAINSLLINLRDTTENIKPNSTDPVSSED